MSTWDPSHSEPTYLQCLQVASPASSMLFPVPWSSCRTALLDWAEICLSVPLHMQFPLPGTPPATKLSSWALWNVNFYRWRKWLPFHLSLLLSLQQAQFLLWDPLAQYLSCGHMRHTESQLFIHLPWDCKHPESRDLSHSHLLSWWPPQCPARLNMVEMSWKRCQNQYPGGCWRLQPFSLPSSSTKVWSSPMPWGCPASLHCPEPPPVLSPDRALLLWQQWFTTAFSWI